MLWHTHFLEHGKHAEEGPHDGGDDDRPSLWWRFVGWWSRCWGRCTGKAARGKVRMPIGCKCLTCACGEGQLH